MATLDVIIKQMILSTLRSAKMDSASPGHVNRFIGLEGGASDIIGSNEEINEAIREAVANIVTDPDSAESLAGDLLDAEQKTGKQVKGKLQKAGVSGLNVATGFGNDPASIIAKVLPSLPQATLILLAISLAPLIFDLLTRPGAPLDLRWKRIISDEVNAFLSRQTQKDTEFGVRQVIIQAKTGFTSTNGHNNYNTLRGIREGGLNEERLTRIGMVDHSKSVFDFG